jgi:hypothetical protein
LTAGYWANIGYLQIKPKLRVLILGSYENSAKKRLEGLKDFLLTKNYLQTALVKDFKQPIRKNNESKKLFNLRKSEYWLPEADVPIFVFFQGVDNSGVSIELKHLIDIYSDMAWRSIVAINDKPSEKPVSSLIGGIVERWKREIQPVYFENDSILLSGVRGALTNLLENLYFSVIRRSPSLWETSR